MKHLGKILPLAFAVVAIVVFSSCSGNSKKGQENNSVLSEIKKDKVAADVAEFVYPLPTAFEVTEMLNRIGASYILSLSNSVENVGKYFTEKSKALNLGIYSADLSYASTYNQKQIAIDYMNASNKLIEELGFEDAIDNTLPEKIEKVENDKDKLIELISNTFYTTYEHLNKNGRGSLSVFVLSGSWVEALYIATHISEDTYNNIEMVKIVMEQKEPLNILMDLIEEHSADTQVVAMGAALENIHSVFEGIEEGSITQEQMKAITKEIASIRDEMVK